MKIAEMEKQIDRLGLEKLEVRLTKGSEVDILPIWMMTLRTRTMIGT